MSTGRVRPGEELGYVQRLKGRDLWPLGNISYDRSDPVTTPYLLVPASPDDNGARPLSGDKALHSSSVQILANTGVVVATPVAGQSYTLRCIANNVGDASAYGGLADFYVAAPTVFDQMAVTPGAGMQAIGYTGFVAMSGGSIAIDCPRSWTPATDAEAASSVLVHIYDPFIDPLIYPFDAREDRHVGRHDIILVARVPIISYLSTGYKYLVVEHDSHAGFEQLSFDDSAFSLGDAAFGTSEGSCPLNNPMSVKTIWALNTDILLRKQFTLPPRARNLEVRIAIDNDVQVFINGRDISRGLQRHEGCASQDSFVFTAPNTLLKVGTNLLAVRGRDRGVLSYLDIQVTATTS